MFHLRDLLNNEMAWNDVKNSSATRYASKTSEDNDNDINKTSELVHNEAMQKSKKLIENSMMNEMSPMCLNTDTVETINQQQSSTNSKLQFVANNQLTAMSFRKQIPTTHRSWSTEDTQHRHHVQLQQQHYQKTVKSETRPVDSVKINFNNQPDEKLHDASNYKQIYRDLERFQKQIRETTGSITIREYSYMANECRCDKQNDDETEEKLSSIEKNKDFIDYEYII
ncbi:unnamed protein product [Didymodactylos carnosus]|uniref:Uncharacterized protein n=1 Tax=Didymodactylos carnosus TaxID=1234261 RepID=A0A814JWC7_9BILA|nr:unnamed protein product [Didymodactylos carnosus]CAF1041222.1 unnamed protein product [Didymodactylos carnosus]CAF3609918.1 unnamed protein product [Didymodactylos carnosus]CAF3811427.1 unnamed protein product [Didymodactylos carnosus]